MAANGDALAAWSANNGSYSTHAVHYSAQSGTWDSAVTDLGAGSNVQVGMADNGDAVAVWESDVAVSAARFTSGAWQL